jgi:hypothetical protein
LNLVGSSIDLNAFHLVKKFLVDDDCASTSTQVQAMVHEPPKDDRSTSTKNLRKEGKNK